jgi:hypothetical protein
MSEVRKGLTRQHLLGNLLPEEKGIKVMQCPNCNMPLEEAAVFCGHCGALLRSQQGPEVATRNDVSDGTAPTVLTNLPPGIAYPQSSSQNDARSTVFDRHPFSGASNIQQEQLAQPSNSVSQPQQLYTPPVQPLMQLGTTAQPPMQSKTIRWRLFIALFLAVIVVGGVIASAIWFRPAKPAPSISPVASGQVKFLDSQASVAGNTDALSITASGLSNPPSGDQYNAWLIDTVNEQILSLGTLSKNGKSFTLTFNQSGKNLLGQGDEVEITQEQQGQPSEPSGSLILAAKFPPRAFVHIRHLLTKFPTTPNHTGLLVGLLNATQELNAQAAILQNSLGDGEEHVRQCLAQSIIDIIEGTNGADYSALSSWCIAQNITQAGDGFGLLNAGISATSHGYLATTAQHTALAANQPDSTNLIRNQARKVEVSTTNIKALLEEINGDAMKLLSNPSDTSQVAEIVSRSDRAYHGFDQNGDSIIEPILGEAGAITAYTQGQLMATLTLSS